MCGEKNAPELNSNFRWLVAESRMEVRLIGASSMCCSTGNGRFAEILAVHQVEVIDSVACYIADNVDKQCARCI
jgi:hypothetical protein